MKNIKFIAILVGAFSFFSCSSDGFTNQQTALIGGAGDGAMRVLKIDDRADSLFLRDKSNDMTAKQLNSEQFGILKERMLATIHADQGSVGMAAPQVGLHCKLIAIQRFDKPDEPFEFYVNPVITEYSSEKSLGGEGCMSVPDIRGNVMRSNRIKISYLDPETFAPMEESVEGFTAVIFQHEVDHLDATLFIDKMEPAHE